MKRINFLIVEGVIIILLTLFSGFLAYQNQKLTKMLKEQSRPTFVPTPTASPSPSPSLSPSASPTATPTPKATVTPRGINY